MIIYVDIDNTLCSPISRKSAYKEIKYCKPYKRIIKFVNGLHKNGHFIMLYTHRTDDCHKETIKWLKKHKVKYDNIRYGKPKWDLLIDDKTLPPYNYLTAKVIEGYIEKIKKWDFNQGTFRTTK